MSGTRIRSTLGVLLVLLAAMAGCAPESALRDDGSDLVELRILHPARGPILSPIWDISAQHLVFLPMFEIDVDGEVRPRLVDSWEGSEDGRTYTYTLRSDIRWHDGVPMTAADMVFSIDLRMEMSERMGLGGWPPAGTTTALVDDVTFSITYPRRVPPRLQRPLWTTYWPRHRLENLDLERIGEWEFWYEPVGNGPFRFVRRIPDTLIELEANPDYYLGPPEIDRLQLRLGGGSALTELWAGTVDAATHVDRAEVMALLEDPNYDVYWQSFGWTLAAFFNHRHPFLSDVRVRRALILATDRETFPRMLDLPENMQVADTLHPGRDEIPPPEGYPYDPGRARALLAEAGWEDVDGDGIREKDGRELVLPATIPASTGFGGANYEGLALVTQDAWRDVGVGLEIRTLEPGVLRRNLRQGDFEAIAFNNFSQRLSPTVELFGPDSVLGYDNPELQRLIYRIHEEASALDWPELYGELMPRFQEDAPLLLLAPDLYTHVLSADFTGLDSPFRADPVGHAEHIRPATRR